MLRSWQSIIEKCRRSDAFRRSRRMRYSRFFGRLQTNNASSILHRHGSWSRWMSDVLAPVYTDMINTSFEQSCFLSSQKEAIVGTRLKKQSLDPADLKSYRPISNISLLSKLIERIAVNRFNVHANLFQLLPVHQSAYWQSHSTETAVTVVHNNIVRATDAGQVSALMLLDLSTAIDTVDHRILMDVLLSRFGVNDHVYEWFHSHLSGRTHIFSTLVDTSNAVALTYSVPQGSVVGSLLFIAYTEDVEDLIQTFLSRITYMKMTPAARTYATHRGAAILKKSREMCWSNPRLVHFQTATTKPIQNQNNMVRIES